MRGEIISAMQRNHWKIIFKGLSPIVSLAILTFFILGGIFAAYYFTVNMAFFEEGEKEFKMAEKSMVNFAMNIEDVAWNIGSSKSTDFFRRHGYMWIQGNAYKFRFTVNESSTTEISTGVAVFSLPVRKYTRGDNYNENLYPVSRVISFWSNETLTPLIRVFSVEELSVHDTIDVVASPRVKVLVDSTISGERNITRVRVMTIEIEESGFQRTPEPKRLVATCTNTSSKTYSYRLNLSELSKLTLKIEIEPLNLPSNYLKYDSTPFQLDLKRYLEEMYCGGGKCGSIVELEIIFYVAKVEVRVF